MVTRRQVVTGGAAGLAGAPAMAKGGPSLAFIYDTKDTVTAPPAMAAAGVLEKAIVAAGFKRVRLAEADASTLTVLVTSMDGPAESFSIDRKGHTLTVSGSDGRGLSYALYELVRRLHDSSRTAFDFPQPVTGQPLNPVRSVMRQFICATYDTPWLHDRAMWPDYLAMLAGNRFNRLHLAFGLGYDQLAHVRDPYLLFAYPYLLSVPGYDVRATGLGDDERQRNLDSLRFISGEAVRHGLDFELGLWMHGYQWPAVDGIATITGLTPETHASYCRAALTQLLKALPAVSSVGLRIHGESGVKEGSYDFWTEIFAGVADAGRAIEIDLHAKGVDEAMIGKALATGMPVNVAPKYWGEHLGLPYHQASIRENEMPKAGRVGQGLMTLSEGSRSFTRYGYADLLREDRAYTVRHRVFAGTQRILASGSGRTYADYGQMFGFCGSTGADVMEPLTYRGRRGTATATARDGYAARKMAAAYDWQKYATWYRSFGLGLYGEAIADEGALAAASRILPLVTTAYAPSAACDAYWPEVYWNQPLADEPSPNPYGDNIGDKVFGNATSFDPQLFSSPREHAAELLAKPGARISPVMVATQLEQLAAQAERAKPAKSIAEKRLAVDTAIQAGLGRFFATKFRAGVLYELYKQTNNGLALKAALEAYSTARQAWAGIVAEAAGVYGDLSSSDMLTEHGAWADKLSLIDSDIAALKSIKATDGHDAKVLAAITAAQGPAQPRTATLSHTLPVDYAPGSQVELAFSGQGIDAATLWYRPVNQAERWQSVTMIGDRGIWRGAIPAETTNAPYPLQYYVETGQGGEARLYPGLDLDSPAQPYFVLRRRKI